MKPAVANKNFLDSMTDAECLSFFTLVVLSCVLALASIKEHIFLGSIVASISGYWWIRMIIYQQKLKWANFSKPVQTSD